MSIEADYDAGMIRDLVLLLALAISSFGLVFMIVCLYRNRLSNRNLWIGTGTAVVGGFLLLGGLI